MKKTILLLSVCGFLGLIGCAESTTDQSKSPATGAGEGETSDTEPSDLQPIDSTDTRGDEPVEPIDYTTVGVPCEPGPTCPGAMLPEWSLLDFQPMSARFGDYYGLDEFTGTVTLVSLHAAWCSYCRTQALLMDQMWKELIAEGHDVQFVTINKDNATEETHRDWMLYHHDQEGNRIYDEEGNSMFRFTFPIFQDTPEDAVWAMHGGNKDDFYIYNANGKLALYLPAGGDISTRLSNDTGYANLKNAVKWVLDGDNAAAETTDSEGQEDESTQEDSEDEEENEAGRGT